MSSEAEVIRLPLPESGPEERPVLVVDFGGQYSQLIARRVREARVYSELVSHRIGPEEIKARNPLALVLSGGPASVYADGAPQMDPRNFELGIPTLGICYGMQLMAQQLGGAVQSNGVAEYGKAEAALGESTLFHDLPPEQIVWMSHRDSVDGSFRRVRASRPRLLRRRSPRSRMPGERCTACSFIQRLRTRHMGRTS